jgi:tetratricopeptide (TPR) repeat protein
MMRSIRSRLLVLACVGVVVAVPALAQQPVTYPPPCDASKVSKGDVDRAHTVYLSGKSFLDESNYDKAISYFNDAYSIDCSVHAILPIIATAYERKGDKAEAIHALEEYLKRVPNAPDREHIERRIKNLSDQLARETPAPSATTAAAPTATVAPAASAAPPPEASASAAPEPAPAAATGGAAPSVEGPKPNRLGPALTMGIGGAAVATGLVLLIVGVADVSSASSNCKSRMNCEPDVANQGNNGRNLETASAYALIPGAVALGAGALWWILQKPAPAAQSGSAGLYVSPVVAPGYAGVSVGSAL